MLNDNQNFSITRFLNSLDNDILKVFTYKHHVLKIRNTFLNSKIQKLLIKAVKRKFIKGELV